MPIHHALTLHRATLRTPIGRLALVTDAEANLVACIFNDDDNDAETSALRHVARHLGPFHLADAAGPREVLDALEGYFAGELGAIASLRVASAGTPFQRAVWGALRRIPAGSTSSYREIAAAVGRPSAVRAVGLANGQNPIGVVVPCHRVIGATGELVGYAAGLARKRWLLTHEGVELGAPQPMSRARRRIMAAS